MVVSDSPLPSPPRGWRRWVPRVTLRGVAVGVLLIGGGLGWFLREVKAQRDAVAAVNAAGGSVYYAHEWDFAKQRPLDPAAIRPVGPRWLVDRLGLDVFRSVVAVRCPSDQRGRFDDRLMGHVGRLTGLQQLDLNGCRNVTDAGVAQLRDLIHLRELDLGATGADPDSLRWLAGMVHLRTLELPHGPIDNGHLALLSPLTALESLESGSCAQVDDAGLVALRGLTHLKRLGLRPARITTEGLTLLGGLLRLEFLSLRGSAVTDLAPIRHLTHLKSLDLGSAPISDASLAMLGKLKNLEALTLSRTQVTDAGLAYLRGLPMLRDLSLAGTRITDDGMAAVATLAGLRSLSISCTAVGDAGLARLAGLDALQSLEAVDTRITDAGLIRLQGLSRCRLLSINSPDLTDEGIALARQARPGLTIRRESRSECQ